MGLGTGYAAVLRSGAAPALAASLLGRLSLGMTGLATLLLVRAATGSYADAGLVAAAYSVSFAIASPARARTADRRGPVHVLTWCSISHPVALLALVVLAHGGAPALALAAPAVAAGLTVPPLGAVMRALWAGLVTGRTLTTAYSLEAVGVELCFVVGPTLTAGLTVLLGAGSALAASAVFTLVGGIALARTTTVRAVRPHADAVHSLAGPLTSRVVQTLLLTMFWIGVSFGAVEVAVPAFAEQEGSRAAAGVLLALWAAGSMVGGLLYGALHPALPHTRQLPRLVGALAVTTVLPLLAVGVGWMGVALFAFGLTIAPFMACNSVLLGRFAPLGTATEAFAWNTSMIFGGAALGNAVAGALADASGPRMGLAVTAVAGAVVLAASLAGLRRLRATEAAPEASAG